MPERALQIPPGFDEMTVDEQVEYVQFLWERIAPRVEQHPVPEWHHEVLDARLDELNSDPDASKPAGEVVERLRLGLRKD